MTTSTITIATITTYFTCDIFNCTPAAIRDTLAAHDDAAHFAELCIIDECDANDFTALTYMIDDDTECDDALELIRTLIDDNFESIQLAIIDAINYHIR